MEFLPRYCASGDEIKFVTVQEHNRVVIFCSKRLELTRGHKEMSSILADQ